MNGGQGAVQRHGRSEFLQSQVRFAAQQSSHLLMMGAEDPGLAPGETMARSDIPGPPPLLQEFLYHPEGNPVTPGNSIPGPLLVIVRGQNPFAQIQR